MDITATGQQTVVKTSHATLAALTDEHITSKQNSQCATACDGDRIVGKITRQPHGRVDQGFVFPVLFRGCRHDGRSSHATGCGQGGCAVGPR